jgi:hypothetical protein
MVFEGGDQICSKLYDVICRRPPSIILELLNHYPLIFANKSDENKANPEILKKRYGNTDGCDLSALLFTFRHLWKEEREAPSAVNTFVCNLV